MRNEHLVYYSIGLQILIFHNSWIANPAEQGDKNLLQSNGHSRNLEIPIDEYFAHDTSPHIRTDCPRTASLIKTDGEIGVPYVADSCFCIGVRMIAKIQKKPQPEDHGLKFLP